MLIAKISWRHYYCCIVKYIMSYICSCISIVYIAYYHAMKFFDQILLQVEIPFAVFAGIGYLICYPCR